MVQNNYKTKPIKPIVIKSTAKELKNVWDYNSCKDHGKNDLNNNRNNVITIGYDNDDYIKEICRKYVNTKGIHMGLIIFLQCWFPKMLPFLMMADLL